MSEVPLPEESKSQNEEVPQNNVCNSENLTTTEANLEEGKRKYETVVNIPDDEGNKGKCKWKSGRNNGYDAFVYAMERAPKEETRKHRSDTNISGGGGTGLRNNFVAKVFLRVFLMFALTAAITGGLMMTHFIRTMSTLQFLLLFIFLMLILMGIQICMISTEAARRGPCSYFMLLLTVLCWSIVCALVCIQYHLQVILFAVIATSICVVICYLLALTSFDFTSWLIYVVVIGMVICVVSLLVLFLGILFNEDMTIFQIFILFASTIVSLVMLIIELQMVLGGHSVEITEEDFNLGAFLLYMSIISLFLKLVQLIGYFYGED